MPRVHYIETNGTSIEVDVPLGQNLMMAACASAVQGILGDCGGALSCATCHVLVDEHYLPLLQAPDDTERQMLEFTATPRQPTSRLSCQIVMREELDGIVLYLPHTQV
jgi:2Fe-2S ferredoxin